MKGVNLSGTALKKIRAGSKRTEHAEGMKVHGEYFRRCHIKAVVSHLALTVGWDPAGHAQPSVIHIVIASLQSIIAKMFVLLKLPALLFVPVQGTW